MELNTLVHFYMILVKLHIYMAYALARAEREPLLFVGNDFIHTDIESALT